MAVFIGLDIGGTKFMAAAADGDGRILRKMRLAAPARLDQGLTLLNRMIEEMACGEEILGIGAAAGGPMDWQKGIISPLHQPAWRDVPLKSLMEERWNCPFSIDVDTNIAALGEFYFGKVSAHRFLYLTLSTGMGGGFLVDGKIYRGANGVHPEVAHQSIAYRCSRPERIHCECGVSDCLEALVSGNGIVRIYGKPAEKLSAEEWSEVGYNVGQGLRNLAAILAPEEIRLGGGVSLGGGEAFLNEARTVMQTHLKMVPPPEVRLSKLGYETALLGAVAIAIHGLEE